MVNSSIESDVRFNDFYICAFSIEYLEFHNQLISIFICFSYIGMCQRQKLLLGHARRGADGRSRQGCTTFQP